MPDNEARVGAFYDHETEEPRATGRRRRQVADWGVGEDVFDRMPSRRFGRRGEEHRQLARHDEPADGRFARRDDDTVARRADAADLAKRDDGRFARRDDATGARRAGADDLAAHQEEPARPDTPPRDAPADWLEETARLATD